MLQPKMAFILQKLVNEYVVCCHRHQMKTIQVKTFEDDAEFIPRSARVKFQLKYSKMGDKDKEYRNLVEQTSTLVLVFQLSFKSNILKSMKIKEKAFENATNKNMCCLLEWQ